MGHANHYSSHQQTIKQKKSLFQQIQFNQNSQQFKQYDLPQYGGPVIVNKNQRKVLKAFKIDCQEDYLFQTILQVRKRLKHKNLVNFSNYQQYVINENSTCSPQYKIYLLNYELCVFSLVNQLKNWCKLQKNIPQYQIIRIFTQVVQCLLYLQQTNNFHGDVKASSIFMDKDRRVKLIDSFFIKQGKTAFQIVLQDPNSMSLLSPEQLPLVKAQKYSSLQNIHQHEMFMVGLTMIQLTTVREGMRCYDLQKLQIRAQFFNSCMKDIIDCGYSYRLANLIMNSVHVNPKQRPTFRQFLNQIKNI